MPVKNDKVRDFVVGYALKRRPTYEKIFWYSSGQLETLPEAIWRWIRSKLSSPRLQMLS